MRSKKLDLLSNVGTSYDQTRTTLVGRITQKTLNSTPVLGPNLNKFLDVVADSAGLATPLLTYCTSNGRVFSLTGEVNGIAILTLHTYDFNTGDTTYVGGIRISLPDLAATTHTLRGLKAVDSGSTGWKIFVATTGSVSINGGTFCVNNIDLVDFAPAVFPTIPFANGSNQKAVYFLQDPAAIGVGQLQIATVGLFLDTANNRIYCHNGNASVHQYYVYDTSATLNCPLNLGTTIDAASDVISDAGHTFLNNDPVRITNLVGGAGLVNEGTYFVRNPVPGVSYQLSTTTGGAVVNITTNGTADICRAFGTTSSAFLYKTGNLPVLTGTLIASDSEDYALPGHTTNAGEPCVFFPTSSTLYLGRISELTAGATTWPSLVTSNLLGTSNQISPPTLVLATWSNLLDKAIYTTNANVFVMKKIINNQIDAIFGGTSNKYVETLVGNNSIEQKQISIGAIDAESGVLFSLGTAVGQRGVFTTDLLADHNEGNSSIITKVLDINSGIMSFVDTLEQLYDVSGIIKIAYRTSGFSSPTGGWVNLPYKQDLSTFSTGEQIQFKLTFDIYGSGGGVPAQVSELFVSYTELNEISENWEYSHDDTNPGANQIVYRLKKSYLSVVPNLRHTVRDLANTIAANQTTAANPSFFEYSIDNGQNWLALGTIPNTVGTLLRYTNNALPSAELRPSLIEA